MSAWGRKGGGGSEGARVWSLSGISREKGGELARIRRSVGNYGVGVGRVRPDMARVSVIVFIVQSACKICRGKCRYVTT